MLERITDDFFAVDREWRYTYLNDGTLRRIRAAKGEDLTREDLLGKNIWEVFPTTVGSIFYHKYHEAVREQTTVVFEAYSQSTGEWYEVRAYPSANGLSIYFQDVTGRKRAEERLVYQSHLLENMQDAVLAADERFALTAWNKGAERIFGWRAEEVLGRRVQEVVLTEFGADHMTRMVAGLSETSPKSADMVMYRKDGTPVNVDVLAIALWGERNEVTGYLIINRDVSERKRAERAAEESRRLLDDIIEQATDTIFVKDTEGRYLLVNSTGSKNLGMPAQSLLGKRDADFFPPEVATAFREFDRQVVETGEPRTQEERVPVRGAPRTFLSTKAPYRDSRGKIMGVIGIAHDITERKQAEEASRHARERLHSLVRHSTDIITVLADDGGVRYQSPAIQRVLGYPPEELVGKNIFDYVHPADLERVSVKFGYLLNNPGSNPLVEFRFRHKDGSWRHLEAIGSNLLGDPSVEGVVVNSRDTTERRKLQEGQQRFLANAAHQLKTPITTIVGAAELLVTKQEDLDDHKKRQLLDHIFSEGRHMQRLSEALLHLVRVGVDRRGPSIEPVDLVQAARQAAGRMVPLAEDLGLSLSVEGQDAYAIADPGWLQQVLLILLENAAKHSGPARKVRLRARKNTVCVEDDGMGMSSTDVSHAFERFYRGKGGHHEGFGLGLSIAKELVERMGGSITLDSTRGAGTTIRIELPGADAGA